MSSTISTVVVGTGLAGLTATLQLLQKGVSVCLIEKTSAIGGNSIKASSGINGVPTKFQSSNADSIDSFIKDTILSGKGLSNVELVQILAQNSAAAIQWLSGDDFNVDLSLVAQLGGHSYPRTHRGSGKLPPGFAIISALSKKLEEYSAQPNSKLKILKNATFNKILVKDGRVSGIKYVSEEKDEHEVLSQNVILATGGYSGDFNEETASLISKHRPDLLSLPSTNGKQTTGDGQKIAERDVGAKLIHMDKIQVHPTGFVQLSSASSEDSTNSKWKFLCGELIRGIGGILISPETGDRFVNELTTRDTVTASIEDSCQIPDNNQLGIDSSQKVAIVVVNELDYLKAEMHINFYLSKGLMFKSTKSELSQLLAKMNPKFTPDTALTTLEETFSNYNSAVQSISDTFFGRRYFGTQFNSDVVYYGLVTPVLHFTMGGIQTSKTTNVITKSGEAIPNLYAIGEVSGGLHGSNRLAGSSLLECVVFGKIAASQINK